MTPDKKYIKERKEEIDDILVKCNSYEQFPMFLRLIDELGLDGELYWNTLADCYQISDDLYQYRDEVKKSFGSDKQFRNKLMTKRELNYLNKLPDTFTIYRGMTIEEFNSGDFGVSWTLKKKVADFFINKYERNHKTNHLQKMIHEITIKKSDVICYFEARNEFEIIYLHKKND